MKSELNKNINPNWDTPFMKNADDYYKPALKENVLVDGIAAESIAKDSKGAIIQKGFMTSLQIDFVTVANNLLKIFDSVQLKDSINSTLILINNDNTAKIYSNFPLSMQSRVKKDIKKGTLATKEDIFDICKLEFEDEIYKVDIKSDDKIIFLFRIDWKFGLFFDFSKKMDIDNLKKNLAYCYQKLYYYELYSFVENQAYFNDFVEDGWFPFIRLIGSHFEKIMQYYKEDKKNDFQIDDLINIYNRETIESFTKYWWKKKIFNDKKEILEAGINSFLKDDKDGFITCLHTLYPQIEGIVGLDYFTNQGKKPSFAKLNDYIKQKAKSKFNRISSTGFPNEFYDYLKKTVFENFDLSTGKLDLSRHTTSHGYANADDFNKAKALQAILILDQIYFYL